MKAMNIVMKKNQDAKLALAGKNIIVHPKHLTNLVKSAEMGALLNSSELGDKELTRVIAEIVENRTVSSELYVLGVRKSSQIDAPNRQAQVISNGIMIGKEIATANVSRPNRHCLRVSPVL